MIFGFVQMLLHFKCVEALVMFVDAICHVKNVALCLRLCMFVGKHKWEHQSKARETLRGGHPDLAAMRLDNSHGDG